MIAEEASRHRKRSYIRARAAAVYREMISLATDQTTCKIVFCTLRIEQAEKQPVHNHLRADSYRRPGLGVFDQRFHAHSVDPESIKEARRAEYRASHRSAELQTFQLLARNMQRAVSYF
jgi:hypothetical protein